jgi:hypothetical protein
MANAERSSSLSSLSARWKSWVPRKKAACSRVPPFDDLHYAIFDIAGLSRLWSIVHGAKAQLDRVRFLTIRDPRQLGAVLVEHGEVVEALGARDARRAGQVMKRHLQTSYRIAEALANLSALPDQSSPRTDIPPDNKRRRLQQWQTGNLPGVGS